MIYAGEAENTVFPLYSLKIGRNISFGRRLLERGTMQRICALIDISFTLTEHGIE